MDQKIQDVSSSSAPSDTFTYLLRSLGPVLDVVGFQSALLWKPSESRRLLLNYHVYYDIDSDCYNRTAEDHVKHGNDLTRFAWSKYVEPRDRVDIYHAKHVCGSYGKARYWLGKDAVAVLRGFREGIRTEEPSHWNTRDCLRDFLNLMGKCFVQNGYSLKDGICLAVVNYHNKEKIKIL